MRIGRSVTSCQRAFQRMEQEFSHIHYNRQSLPSQNPPFPLSPTSRKRPISATLPADRVSGPRAIQPKPTLGGERLITPNVNAAVPIPRFTEPFRGDTRRKRGRPSKADIQRRNMLNQPMIPPTALPKSTVPSSISSHDPSPTTPGLPPSLLMSGGPQRPISLDRMRDTEQERPSISMPQFQATDVPGSQAQDIQSHRISRPPPRMESGIFTETGPGPGPGAATGLEPKEPISRTILDNQMAGSPTSLGPSLGSSAGQRTEGPGTFTSSGGGTPVCVDSTPAASAVSGLEEEKEP